MPKDYKDAPAPRAESRLNHPLLLGVIIGLLLGIVISLAVALWLNRLSNPFVDKNRAEPAGKMLPGAPPPVADAKGAKPAPRADEKAEKPKTAERPRFEFYQMLPGDKEVTENEVKAARRSPQAAVAPAPAPEKPAAPPPRPGSSPTSPKPHSGEVFWLQAGAFSEEREADNLKARIALTGLEASVRAVNIPDKGTLFRVRLGPYQSLEEANRNKIALTQQGVSTAIIRTEESR